MTEPISILESIERHEALPIFPVAETTNVGLPYLSFNLDAIIPITPSCQDLPTKNIKFLSKNLVFGEEYHRQKNGGVI